MKVNAEFLKRQWDRISYYDHSFLRVDTEHPLEWYIGYTAVNLKALLLISDAEIGAIPSSKSMSVKRGRRETDNRWTLTFELLRDEQQDVFMNLCCDIVEYSRNASHAIDALDLVLKRYKQWNRLLEYQKQGLMDESARKGLIGELLFLQQRINKGMKLYPALQGWEGPDGADQDFVYSDSWYEIKTIGLSSQSISISSLEQLSNTSKGFLITMRVDKCPAERPGAFSLNNLVNNVHHLIKSDLDASALFQEKLGRYGYIDLPEYAEQTYYFSKSQVFEVNDSFPKVIRDDVADQVITVQYTLGIAGLSEWLRKEN
jgi:hypothetical protein